MWVAMIAGMYVSTTAGCDDESDPPAQTTSTTSSTSSGGAGGSTTTTTPSGQGGDAGSGGATGGGGAGGGPLCFTGGTSVSPTGSGTCADPYFIDMTAVAAGEIRYHDTGAIGADEADMGGPCGTEFTSTGRDVVYHLDLADTVTGVEISVDAAGGADPRIGVAEDPSCGQPINACADEGGSGSCEYLLGPKDGTGFFGDPYVIISEATGSGTSFTVRFRPVQ
jgi:hypothetical protein